MKHIDYWSKESNPESGAWFDYEKQCLIAASNGTMDIDALLAGEYGEALTENYLLRLKYGAPCQEALDYLATFGVRKELHDTGDYYSRWCICLPTDIPNDDVKKYPLIIVNSNVDNAQFAFGFYKIAAKERFLYLTAQNNNWDNLTLLIEEAAKLYPIDKERVYITGFSYTGYQATGAFTHTPWKYAAAAPCGNDTFRPTDNFMLAYTEDELASLRHFVVPFMQMVGVCEASNFVPLNDYHIRATWGNPKRPEGLLPARYKDPRENPIDDPTMNPIRKLPDGTIQNTPPSAMPAPPEGMNRHVWQLSRLNKRLDLLRCEPRNMETCISYLDKPEDELHHVLGFYGDREEIKTIKGLKHYCIDIWNRDGLNVFRYVALENHPHTVPATAAELIWDFFRQFKRDSATGKIVADEYRPG